MSGKCFTVLVTGANGQLGQELTLWNAGDAAEADAALNIVGFGRDTLDITIFGDCRRVFAQHRPDAVIHCAAYTAVDRAESEPDEAYRINAAGTRNVAVAAREIGAKLTYVSTDYVFDGSGTRPYSEYDRPNPQTVYGKSKLAGEQLVQTLHERYFIVRTSWLYGRHGNNFVKTMLKLGSERERLKVVHDQVGSPTSTLDLARFLLELVRTDYYGIYHASNAGSCSWYEFAKAIFEESGLKVQVDPCTTGQIPRPAPRPAYSVMDRMAIRVNGLTDLPHWREALRQYVRMEKECRS
ncbi:dTDP-4-dehydrorhamnose reductase [Paenibacillus alkalitolerans]|uniref:dTDP-4-dehydrorhamnose reductase n=1 Tax=Paenibacillus alkalitolerans TaxID=2799335 RepID=UPI0018F6E98B|nr:dTDP-4-dehydrorhamnose reductase [Paenibacillus alkalitolerans]